MVKTGMAAGVLMTAGALLATAGAAWAQVRTIGPAAPLLMSGRSVAASSLNGPGHQARETRAAAEAPQAGTAADAPVRPAAR